MDAAMCCHAPQNTAGRHSANYKNRARHKNPGSAEHTRDFFLLLEVSEAAVVGAILLHNFPIRFQLEGQLAYPGLGECFGVIHGDIDR